MTRHPIMPPTRPPAIPMMPPITHITAASMINCWRMALRFAPMALRVPISRVRSVMVTVIIFMTPMPPTSSAIAAISEIVVVCCCIYFFASSIISLLL